MQGELTECSKYLIQAIKYIDHKLELIYSSNREPTKIASRVTSISDFKKVAFNPLNKKKMGIPIT